MGGKKLAQVTKADGDALVAWMLTEGRVDQRRATRPDSLSSRIAEFIAQHPEGISTRDIAAEFPGTQIHTPLSALVRAGRIARTGRRCAPRASWPRSPPESSRSWSAPP
ncbi:hypothetical protein ACPESR_03870 [Nocardia testacea]|uniref:hypothetical protein n=1 Tax=Nocardia testacea TaxID=248551 RepID=UPI0002F1BBB4|nr:hypothetical protein [Nocardia testacea]